jgi:energy-coupling factor transport system substrate-specific component
MALSEENASSVESFGAEEKRPSLTKKVWGIGVRHVVFMALGAALYAGLSYVTNSLQLPGASNVSIRPAIVIPLFFGSVFGPWVGLFSGLVGNSINDTLTGGIYWNWEIGIGLVGFVPGLVMYFTKGRYNTVRRIVLAELFTVLGVIVGIGFASITDIWASKMTFVAVITTELIPSGLSDIVLGLILLPILLVAYNAALGRTGRS